MIKKPAGFVAIGERLSSPARGRRRILSEELGSADLSPLGPAQTGTQVESSSRAKGVPSESRQIDQRSPGWTMAPPNSVTRCRAALMSAMAK
jgi:hypothetical protein